MFSLVDLTGKKIIVTGASQGIGKETAKLLSRLGAHLILVARNEDKLKEVLAELDGAEHKYYVLDLSDNASIEIAVKNIIRDNGLLDGLVYCAGVADNRPLNLYKPNIVKEIFDTNLFGFIELVRAVSKKGRFNKGMRIVGVSSTAALCGAKANMAYSASKAGMDGAVRCMACELAEKEICINTVAPAMTRTRMYEGYIKNYGEDSDSNRTLMRRQYLGVGETIDIASAIAFLISPASRFITGICMPVDGGYTTN